MAFIRTKRIKGILYRYRVESTRAGGKVQQRVLEYLGRASAKPAKGRPKAKKAAKAARKGVRKAAGRTKTKARKGGRNRKKRK
jgi:hypothetical protein